LTDIQLHTNARLTPSASKTIKRSIESNQPGRIFSPLKRTVEVIENNTVISIQELFNPDQLKSLVQEYQKQGKRVFIAKPKNGIPAALGRDAVEFMNSVKGRRSLRRLEKEQQVV
jgi:hypothetical protein